MSKSAKLACVIGCVLLASTPVLAADNLAPPHYKAAVSPQIVTWTGAYIGATLGYGWTESASTITAIDTIITPFFLSQGTTPRSLNSPSMDSSVALKSATTGRSTVG
jgi:outer membrane immunogenic protein